VSSTAVRHRVTAQSSAAPRPNHCCCFAHRHPSLLLLLFSLLQSCQLSRLSWQPSRPQTSCTLIPLTAVSAAAAAAAAELSAEQAELAAKQAEAAVKEKIIADALKQGDAEMAAIDAMNEEDLLANLDADELAALEAELAELEG
jgi:hypothetical protein